MRAICAYVGCTKATTNNLYIRPSVTVKVFITKWITHLFITDINNHQSLSLIILDICIDLNHYCHHYWTSESLLNLWECTQGSDITNKWVVYFVIKKLEQWC